MSSVKASEGSGAAGVDGVDAPVDADRVFVALQRVRELLGPDAVPELTRADGTDDASLAEGVDAALLELGDLVMSYTGPDALELTRTATSWRISRGRYERRRSTGAWTDSPPSSARSPSCARSARSS